jgi:primary-amine oxidase
VKKLSTPQLKIIFFLSLWTQGSFAALHPLEDLSRAEILETVKILRADSKVTEDTLFPYILLVEPPKKEVLAYTPGSPFRRESLTVLYQRKVGKTFEAIVDLRTKKISSWKEIAGVQPSVMLSEFTDAPPIVKADPRFAAAMKKRGITNLDDVVVDIWAYGNPDTSLAKSARLLRAIAYFKGKGQNFYARPIDGFTAIVNMDQRRVEEVIDTDVLPVPPQSFEYAKQKKDPRLKPMKVLLPQGPSFKVRGQEVEWLNWKFRYSMHPREGLVLHLVSFKDGGRWRPVLFRASLSEMMVPYGHNNEHWTYRNAFDEGEYGIGRYSGSLEKGTDVPEHAQLFDSVFADDLGKPYAAPQVVALYERDAGLKWKHFDMYGGSNTSVRARHLVLGFITTISNYDYGLNWVFHEDGTLELETQLTGIMLAKGSSMETMKGHDHGSEAHPDMKFGHLVAPNVVAPHHQHFFNMRLDLDVDGPDANSVAELNSQSLKGSQNPAHNAFTMSETPLQNEKEGVRDLSYEHQRKWKVFNPLLTNSLGYHPSYVLLPGENASPFLLKNSPLLTRGGFVKSSVWFTAYDDQEKYAAGFYPNQRGTTDGLETWMKKNRSLEKNDVVMWYTFCVTHAPRPEEWPVMNVHRTGFKLLPAGFFEKNPSVEVAR